MKAIHSQITKTGLMLLAAASLVLLGGGVIAADLDPEDKLLDRGLTDRLAQGEPEVDVIVLLNGYQDHVGRAYADDQSQMAVVQSEIARQQSDVLDQLDSSQFELKRQFENILGFAGSVTEEGLRVLLAMPEVQLIEEDEIEHMVQAQGIPLMNALGVRSTYSGTGISVAISDTGIDYNHVRLGGGGFPNAKVIGGYDFGDNDSNPLDCQGHGTAVAGITSGDEAVGPGDYIGGVAHNSKLYALKIVPGCTGSASSSDIAASWDWAVTHKNDDPSNPILVINTSFSGATYTSACDASEPTYAAAANNAVANGIAVFASSGNGANKFGIGRPACVTNAISVGAVYDANIGPRFWSNCTDMSTAADQVTCYSNSDTFLDLLGPSNDAYTTAMGGGYDTDFGGTSAASPYSAGAGAILQHHAMVNNGSYQTVAALKAAMVNNGDPITDPGNGVTKPRVNVGNAVGPAWDYCLQDTDYTAQLWFNVEGGVIIRGQALAVGSSFPAPITGTYNLHAPGDFIMSVDYKDEAGLRIYTAGMTFAISDSDSSIYNGPRSVSWALCSPASRIPEGGDSGADDRETLD